MADNVKSMAQVQARMFRVQKQLTKLRARFGRPGRQALPRPKSAK